MRRVFVVVAVFLLTALSFVSVTAAEQGNTGVLRHFVTLPSGISGEGLAIHDGHFYVGTFSFTNADGTILVLDRHGTLTRTIRVPGLPGVGELAFSEDGTLYAVAGNLNTGTGGSVFRVNPDSGTVAMVASGFKLPNGLAIDDSGNLFVTDLLASQVYKITPAGEVSVFASGPLLGAALLPQVGLTLGTNDLAFDRKGTALYVTDVGLGTVVKIEVNEDGTAGTISNFALVPTPDGIAFDVKGNMYVTSPFTNSVQIVGKDGTAHALALDTSHVSLNNPSNVAFLGRQLYITNLALAGTSEIDSTTVQHPGLPLDR